MTTLAQGIALTVPCPKPRTSSNNTGLAHATLQSFDIPTFQCTGIAEPFAIKLLLLRYLNQVEAVNFMSLLLFILNTIGFELIDFNFLFPFQRLLNRELFIYFFVAFAKFRAETCAALSNRNKVTQASTF